MLEETGEDDDVGGVGAHFDEVVVGDVEVERVDPLARQRCWEDRVEAARPRQPSSRRGVRSGGRTHLRCRRRCLHVLAIMSFALGSSSAPSSVTSPHLRYSSWFRKWNKTSTEVMAKTTSLTLKVVGFGRHLTPCSSSSAHRKKK